MIKIEVNLRKYIIALLEIMIKYENQAGLTVERLSERKLNSYPDKIKKTLKYLKEFGAIDLIESENNPYGFSQSFITNTGKLYYKQFIEKESNLPIEPLIPIEIQESLKSFKKDHPDPSKVGFIMMKFAKTKDHTKISKTIKETLASFELIGVRSDDKDYHDDLFPNVLTYIYGSGFGVAVFERIEGDEFNPNVALEVGYMMALKKPVCLLKDKTIKTLQADLLGKLYKKFDTRQPNTTIPNKLSKWLVDKKIIVQEITISNTTKEIEMPLNTWVPSNTKAIQLKIQFRTRNGGDLSLYEKKERQKKEIFGCFNLGDIREDNVTIIKYDTTKKYFIKMNKSNASVKITVLKTMHNS